MSIRMSVRALLIACLAPVVPAFAQARAEGAESSAAPRAATTDRLISVSFKDVSARDALADLGLQTRLTLRPIWSDAADPIGLDPEARINLTISRAPVMVVIESLLRQCEAEIAGGATWQLADDGAIELGSRSRLNQHPVTRIYDIHDLLAAAPDFPEGATIDLQAALQARTGGGVLREHDRGDDIGPRPNRAQELLDLITQTVEPDQWWMGGATIRVYNGQLVVHAAAYIQRQIVSSARPPEPAE